MKNYEKLRTAYLEHYIAELTKEHPKVFQPDVFYESHTDYLPLTIDYSVLEDYYRDLRDCVKDHPKLIYLLLAAVCPLFQIFGCANYSFIFYFRSNDETLNWFISRLVSSMYGMPESSDHDEKIDFSKMSKVSHCHKAYYLNEIPYNSFNEHDDLRFLDDSYLTRTNNLYGKNILEIH